MKKYIFNKNDFNSGDGMMTSIWGPPMWHVLHTISFNYPVKPTKEQKKHYFNFYNNLQNILPCKYCRDNIVKNMEKIPLNMKVFKNRENLSTWVYELHEIVNKMLNKVSGLSFEDIRQRYETFRARCIVEDSKLNYKTNIETGCTEPLYGSKSQCILNIVPKDARKKSLTIDSHCFLKKKK